MEDPQVFLKEDDLKKMKMEEDQKKIMQPKTIKSKNYNIFENGR